MNVLALELAKYYEEVSPYDFYREIFGEGELDEAGAYTEGKYTAIALEITNEKRKDKNGKEKIVAYRHTVTDDLDMVKELTESKHFCVMAPISYAGKSRASKNARIMYALGVELDNLRVKENGQQIGLENLIDRYADKAHWIPKPTFIVASGSGVHLYYQFEQPLVLFPNTIESLRLYKEELTKMIWSKSVTTTHTKDTIQQESIFQGFRMPGTLTKKGDKAVAFRVGGRVSIDYMNKFMRPSFKGSRNIEGVYRSDLRLEEAKEKYPEWYEKVIVNKDKSRKEWALSRNVYDWWLREIKDGATDGHRYFCLKMLAIYAIKCSNYHPKKNPNPVTQEEFEKDTWSLLEDFDARGKRADNPFTEYDVLCALQVYEDRGMITYPRNSIAHKSGIEIIPSIPRRPKGKRLKQEEHIKMMNYMRDNVHQIDDWRNKEGRPIGSGTAQEKVREWREEHPNGKKTACIKDTGLSKKTVYKWWDGSPAAALSVKKDTNKTSAVKKQKKQAPATTTESTTSTSFDWKETLADAVGLPVEDTMRLLEKLREEAEKEKQENKQ